MSVELMRPAGESEFPVRPSAALEWLVSKLTGLKPHPEEGGG